MCVLWSFFERGTKYTGANMKTKHRESTEGKAIKRLPHMGIDPTVTKHNTTVDAKKCLMTGA